MLLFLIHSGISSFSSAIFLLCVTLWACHKRLSLIIVIFSVVIIIFNIVMGVFQVLTHPGIW